MTLAQARAKSDKAKKLSLQGNAPSAEQKETQAENLRADTVETIALQWHSRNKRWIEDHCSRIHRHLGLYIFSQLGSFDIRQLKTNHVYDPIKKFDVNGKHDVVQCLQQYVLAILH